MELDQAHSENVQQRCHQTDFKVEFSGSSRHGMIEECVEDNIAEGDGNVEDGLDRTGEEN